MLQIICSVLVDELNARRWQDGDPPIDANDVTAAADAAIDRAENYFLDMWANTIPAAARPLIRNLAQHHSAATGPHATHDLIDVVLVLERRHVITRIPSGYALTVPLFAHYIRSKQSLPA